MTFEEYATKITWRTVAERTKAKAVWEQAYRQGYKDSQVTVKKIDDSKQVINRMRHENPRYKRWLELNYESE